MSVDEVLTAIRCLPDKSSAADPIPVSALKQLSTTVAPFFAELFNRTLLRGHVPACFKSAFITPRLKKTGLNVADASSYRPISNLSVASKLLERLVCRRLFGYLQSADLLPTCQSAYCPNHSTETATLRVMSDILEFVDQGDVAVLVLLDLSAAFDTVDHDILIRRLELSFGITGCALEWFRSYLTGRTQHVRLGTEQSPATSLTCGVPQGSVLGPVLFLLYTADLPKIIGKHGLLSHLYADDTQIYGSCRPADTDQLQSRVSACIDEVASWMQANRLQLNTAKTEVMWFATARRQFQLPTCGLRVVNDIIIPSTSACSLGVFVDSDLTMRTHVSRTVSRCFATLRQLRSVRRSLPSDVFQSLIASLVLTRLDYGNATLAGISVRLTARLQSVLNAAARMIFGLRRRDHISQALADLHWLRTPERIHFKLAVTVYNCLHETAPSYLSRDIHRLANISSRQRLRSSSSLGLVIPRCRLSTVGDRSFAVAAARVWNSLPNYVTSAPSVSLFRKRLKAVLFRRSFFVD